MNKKPYWIFLIDLDTDFKIDGCVISVSELEAEKFFIDLYKNNFKDLSRVRSFIISEKKIIKMKKAIDDLNIQIKQK